MDSQVSGRLTGVGSFFVSGFAVERQVPGSLQQDGILVNYKKLHLVPSQEAVYPGMKLDSLKAFLTQEWIQALLRELEEFLSHHLQPALDGGDCWVACRIRRRLCQAVKLHIKFLQLGLSWSWDHQGDSVVVPWGNLYKRDLEWYWMRHIFAWGLSRQILSLCRTRDGVPIYVVTLLSVFGIKRPFCPSTCRVEGHQPAGVEGHQTGSGEFH